MQHVDVNSGSDYFGLLLFVATAIAVSWIFLATSSCLTIQLRTDVANKQLWFMIAY
jgi:hypothetical protein